MKEGPDIARIAALIGDPARANMLTALMSGKAVTATELAQEANVTLQTASTHLSKLDEGGLLRPRKQGRHKYFSLANDDVARVLEGLMGLAAGSGHLRSRTGPRDPALRKARVCYNHLAGDLGIRLTVLSVATFCRHAAELSTCPKQVTSSQMILVLMLEVFYPAKCLSAASVSTGVRAGRIWPGAWGAHSSAVLKRRAGQSENEEQGSCASRHWARKRSRGRFRSNSSAQLSPFFSRSRR